MPVMAIVLGAAVFTVTHTIEASFWGWFGGAHQPWFLNSGRAVAFTAACFFMAGAVLGVTGRARWMRDGPLIGIGGGFAAAVLLFTRVGAGNLFPIAIVLATLVLMASSTAGLIASGRSSPRSR